MDTSDTDDQMPESDEDSFSIRKHAEWGNLVGPVALVVYQISESSTVLITKKDK